MAQISVGEFDRIIKSLYTNDITMAKTIYGEAGQVGLKDTVIKAVRATSGQGKTVNTYELVRANDEVLDAAIVDTDTKITGNKLTFANGTLTSEITDNAGGTFASSVNGIASQEWVQEKIAEIPSIIDTNSITTVQNDGNGYVTVTGGQGDDGNYHYTVGINEDKLVETIQANDTNTITTAKSGHAIITVNDSVGGDDLDDKNYVIGIDENALKGFIQDNTQDTNTVTTVAVNTNILTIEDNGEGSNHAYELGINSEKLNEAIEAQDRYVNGGSIGADGKITLKVRNGEDVKLDGQLKDAQLTEIERDKAAGTATLVVKDGYTNEEVRRLTIDDIASKAQNDKEHAEFREHFSELDHRVDNLGSRVDKVGAGAAALAALHPMDFDPDDKLTFAAGYGNYKGKNAAAVGAFYRPDEKVMLSVGGTFGNGENMVNAGISFSLDRTARVSNSRTAMAKEIVDLRANVANLTALVGQLTAGMGGTIEMDRMKLFPDVPENHWAYEYIGRLAAAGIVEGYPDGMFNGNRMMSRYEFAAMLYRALEKGVKLDHKLVREFEPEMGRIHVARISGADGDRGKIERVRVYGGDNRDHYGSKLN